MRQLAFALALACALALPCAATTPAPSPANVPALHVPAADQRAESQTYLTFPEWFLVFSPNEYATWLRHHAPTRFPFFAHIREFWTAYAHVIEATRRYPFNGEYHTMICVIGVSTTIEYTIKGSYDTLIGRLSQLGLPANATPEDRLAAATEADYVRFIRIEPWYKFDFLTPLRRLWTGTPWWGPHPVRKWERRYALTTEWSVKATYGWLLGKATHASYATPKESTLVVMRDLPGGAPLPAGVRLLRAQGGEALLALPRYAAFTPAAESLARRGASFVDIAGNRGVILVSVVTDTAPSAWPDGSRVLFTQPIVTQPTRRRTVLQVPVEQLGALLNRYANHPGAIEHVFDY